MRTTTHILASLVLLGASGLALAHNCPNEMKAIDAKLETKPQMSKGDMDKVMALRKSGEEHHKAGKHNESMKDLGEAKKLLGM